MTKLNEMAEEYAPGMQLVQADFKAGYLAALESSEVRELEQAARNINGNIPGSTKTLKLGTPVLWECMQDIERAVLAFRKIREGLDSQHESKEEE